MRTFPIALAGASRKVRASAFIAAVVALLVVAASPAPLSAENPTGPEHPARLDSRLARVLEGFERGGASEAVSVAQGLDIDTQGDKLRVIVETSPGRSDHGAAAARGLNAAVEGTHGDLVQVLVPVAVLKALSQGGAVAFVRPPLVAVPLVTSQGVSLTNASSWHGQGLTGAGVKVAVLDLGFCRTANASGTQCLQDYTGLLGTELPSSVTAMSFDSACGITGCGIVHGTAVAEIVHDMAPGAQLYLANFSTEVELAAASQWLTAQGVHVINASWGYFTSGPGDGTGIVDDVVTQSVANGTMWSVAAGNHAQKHWSGIFNDTDSNLFHEFQNTPFVDEGNQLGFFIGAGEPAIGELKWDDPFGAACRDYDLYLMRTDETLPPEQNPVTVAASQNRQYDGGCVPGADPVEMLFTTAPVADTYHLVVKKHFALTNATMHLYSAVQDLEYQVIDNSVLQPADNPNVMTVGAVYWNSPNSIEYFSSRGPTTDGRIKPDIAGPDGVSTVTYGAGAFFGTSAASPHLAGAAALLKQRLPCNTPAQLQAFLETNVIDLAPAGKDNMFGSGRLSLGAAPLDTDADGTANACDTDDDNDAWSDAAEGVIGTNPLLRCGGNAWPADITNNGFVDTGDIGAVTNDFGDAVPGAAPARHDLAPDPPLAPPNAYIDTGDIGRVTALFGQGCGP